MNSATSPTASSTMAPRSRPSPVLLRLVEEAAALEQLSPLLGGDLHISRREEEYLVGDALHAAVQGVGEPAREVDQPLRQLGVGALQVEDHGHPPLEPIRDLLGVVEAAREDEVHPDTRRVRDRFDLRSCIAEPRRADRRRTDGLRVGLGLRPVVVLVPAPARRQPPDVRALAVALLEALLGGVSVLVVPLVVLLGDAEVHERAIPQVAQRHGAQSKPVRRRTARSRRGRTWPPRRPRFRSPGSSPSRARRVGAAPPVRADGGTTAATPRPPRPPAASSKGRRFPRRDSRPAPTERRRTSTARRRG